MNIEKSVRQIAAEWNSRANADGSLLERDPCSLPALHDGSLLDVPLTPEAEDKIRHLDALLASLEKRNAAAAEKHQDMRSQALGITVLRPVGEGSEAPATVAKS